MKPLEKYKEIVKEAIEIDNRLYKLSLENRGPRARGRGGYQSNQGRQRGYYFRGRRDYRDPMDLDLTYAHGASRARNERGRGRGKRPGGDRDQEKERRRKENLCYICGKSGHHARDCQKGAQGLHIMNMEGGDAGGSVENKADTTEKVQSPANGKDNIAQKETLALNGHKGPWGSEEERLYQ